MQRLSRQILLPAALALLAGLAAFAWFQPEIKLVYWGLVAPGRGPEAHGSRVLRTAPSETPYTRWLERNRAAIPVFEGFVVDNVATAALRPWPAMGEGVHGLYLRLADYQITDGRILELPAGGQSAPQRHAFEMGVHVLGGPGHTLLFAGNGAPLRLDWQAGSVFSVPLNVRYQHVNDSPGPVRLLAVTSFPFAINTSGSEAYIFANPYDFTERFSSDPAFLTAENPLSEYRSAVNFVADARTATLVDEPARGEGNATTGWTMAGNRVLDIHVSEIPPRTRKRAHRHNNDSFILVLSGRGYTMHWAGEDVANRKRIDWQAGTLFSPPTYWYHQHHNPGDEPARYLAINALSLVRDLGVRFSDQLQEGPPEIRAEWEQALGLPAMR